MYLRCPYDSLSGPDADELLQFSITQMNSSSEKFDQENKEKELISLSIFSSISQNYAVLNDK